MLLSCLLRIYVVTTCRTPVSDTVVLVQCTVVYIKILVPVNTCTILNKKTVTVIQHGTFLFLTELNVREDKRSPISY